MRVRIRIFVLCLAAVALACNIGTTSVTPTQPAAPPTEPIITAAPSATEAPPEPTVVEHKTIPGDFPAEPSGIVGDQDSSVTADQKRAPSGDRFTFSRFERPFNAGTMDVYFPSIDIQGATLFQDEAWLYVEIKVKNAGDGGSLDGKYGFEIDLNVDGDGDLFVLALHPSSVEWSTTGVEVWEDSNDDVGGISPTITDKNPPACNGFENMLFGDGNFNDPDLAWARVSSADPYAVQIALKRGLLAGDSTFLVGVWAGNEDLNPALFDINDLFTHEQAGASEIGLEYFYPIKEVSELDNTCRMAIGFQPNGNEPGLCPLPPKPGEAPSVPSESSCPPQYIYCFNTGSQTICICAQP